MKIEIILISAFLITRFLITAGWLLLFGGFIIAPVISIVYYIQIKTLGLNINKPVITTNLLHAFFLIGILFQFDVGDDKGYTTIDRLLFPITNSHFLAPYMESIYKTFLPDSVQGVLLSGIFSFIPFFILSLFICRQYRCLSKFFIFIKR